MQIKLAALSAFVALATAQDYSVSYDQLQAYSSAMNEFCSSLSYQLSTVVGQYDSLAGSMSGSFADALNLKMADFEGTAGSLLSQCYDIAGYASSQSDSYAQTEELAAEMWA